MGQLIEIWDQFDDPDDAIAPYTPFRFIQAGHQGVANMSMDRSFERRGSFQIIPGLDSALDHYYRTSAPMKERYMPFAVRFWGEDLDALYDAVALVMAGGEPKRLVYETDQGTHWYTVGSQPKIGNITKSENKGGTSHIDFDLNWLIRPDWRLRYSQGSEIWGVNDGVWGTGDTNWGVTNAIALPLVSNNLSLDNTGVLGDTMPTLDDTGPRFEFTGGAIGFGGTGFENKDANNNNQPLGGIQVVNGTAKVLYPDGTRGPMYMILPQCPAGATMVVDLARQRFTLGGVPFRPYKPYWQREYFRVKAAAANSISITAIGGSLLNGSAAYVVPDWWKKRA